MTVSFRNLAARRETGVAVLLGLTVAVVAGLNPAFVSGANIRDMLVQCAPAAIVGCGLTFVLLTGEIDISLGSMMGFLAAVMGLATSSQYGNLPAPAGIAITLAAGTAIGLLNGVLVSVGRVPSIIVTLGMLTALRGLTELIMGGKWISGIPPGLRYLGTGTVIGVPISIWVAAVTVVLAWLFARETPAGRRIYALGSNPKAAVLAGLSPTRIKLFVFALTGFLVAVATLVGTTQLSVIESGIGVGFEMVVVTSVVVGGASISGGKGTIPGMLLGVILLGIVRTVLIFLNLGETSVYWERAIQGAFILVAVLMDHLAARRRTAEVSG
jgi:rhamnose transport system permease protein